MIADTIRRWCLPHWATQERLPEVERDEGGLAAVWARLDATEERVRALETEREILRGNGERAERARA